MMAARRASAIAEAEGDPGLALREHLLATTARLLEAQSAREVTTRAIARAGGVSVGVLYNYFRDRDELVVAALVRRFTRLLESFEAAELAGATLEGRVTAYAHAVVDLHADALPLLQSLAGDRRLLASFMREIHRPPLGGPRILAPLVELLRADGVAEPDAAADLLVGAIAMRVATLPLGHETRDRVRGRVPALVRTLLEGARAR